MTTKKKAVKTIITKNNINKSKKKEAVPALDAEQDSDYIFLNECANAARDVHVWLKDLLIKAEDLTKKEIIEDLRELDELMDMRLGTGNNKKS